MPIEFDPSTDPEWRATLRRAGGQIWHRVHAPGLPTDVTVRLGLRGDGRLVCTGLMIGLEDGSEVTARSLRTVHLGEILAAAAEYVAGTRGSYDSPLHREVERAMAKQLLVNTADEVPETVRIARPGKRGHPDEYYQKVAELYREAMAATVYRPMPVKRVAERLHVEPRTAQRHIATARSRGFLGASIPNRAGEQL